MANELNYQGTTGLTVTAKLYLNGAVVGSAISMGAVSGGLGLYVGSMPGSLAAGLYAVQFFASAVVIGQGTINWNGVAEVTSLQLETDVNTVHTVPTPTATGHELNASLGTTGLTVTAQLYASGSAVGSAISCPEVASQGGLYSATVPGGVAAGVYQVQFLSAGSVVGTGVLNWNGTCDVTHVRLEADIQNVPSGGGGGLVTGWAGTALADLKAYITGVVAIVRGPISADQNGALTMSITIGDDYSASDLRAIDIGLDGTALPDLTTASVELHLQTGHSVVIVPGTITVKTGNVRTVRFQPTAALTSLLRVTMDGRFSVVLTVSTRTITPPEGRGVLTAVMRITG